MTDIRRVNLNAEVLKGTAGKIAIALVKFVSAVVFAQLLGPAAFGGVYLLFRISTVAIRPAIGWAKAVKKRYSEVGTVTDATRDELFGLQLLFTAGWATICAIGAVIFQGYLSGLTGLQMAGVLLGMLIFGEAFERTLGVLLTATGRVGLSTGLKFGRVLLTFPLQLLFLYVIATGPSGIVYGLFIATLLGAGVALRFVGAEPSWPSLETLTSVRRFARYSIPNAVFGTLYENIDVILLGIVLTSASAGYYEAAFRLTLPAIFLAEAAATGLMSKVSAANSQEHAADSQISEILSYTSILAVPLFFGTVPLADEIIRVVYGPAFSDAAVLLVGLALYQILLSQSKPILASIDGMNRPNVTFRLSVTAFCVNVLLGVALAVEIGAIGVVISTILAETIRYVGGVWSIKRITVDQTIISKTLLVQLLSALVMAICVWRVKQMVQIESPVSLTGVIVFGAVTYSILLLITSHRTRTLSRSVLSKKRS